MNFKLYELSEAMNQVAAMIDDGAEGLEDTLESLDGSFQDKVESIVKLKRSKEAEAEIVDMEIARLKQRSDKLKKDADWLHNYVEREMQRANLTEVKSSLFKIALNLTPPRVEVINQSQIPEKYLRTSITVSPDKVAIKEAYGRGEHVPGCDIRQDMKLKVR